MAPETFLKQRLYIHFGIQINEQIQQVFDCFSYLVHSLQISNDPSPGYNIEQMAKK